MSARLVDLDAHLEVLVRLRRVSGADVYDRALLAARVAVAKVILAEAQRRSGVGRNNRRGAVVPFRRLIVEDCDAHGEEQ